MADDEGGKRQQQIADFIVAADKADRYVWAGKQIADTERQQRGSRVYNLFEVLGFCFVVLFLFIKLGKNWPRGTLY